MDEYRVALEVAGPAAMFARPDTLPARERGLKLQSLGIVGKRRKLKKESNPERD